MKPYYPRGILQIALFDPGGALVSGVAIRDVAQAEQQIIALRERAVVYGAGCEISILSHSRSCSGRCPDYLGLEPGCEEVATYTLAEEP